mgnify:CR=1 FL=1
MKLRISECEEWVVDLRNKCSEYEIQYNDVMEKFEEEKHNNSVLESEKTLLVSELQEIKKQKLTIENDLK